MKKIRFALLACLFSCFAHYAIGQQDAKLASLCKFVERQYINHRNNHWIVENENTWFFVSIVNSDHYIGQTQKNYASISEDNVREFFIRTKVKNYPNYTYSSNGITNLADITPIYEELRNKKKEFYNMPLVGKFQVSINGEAHVFAKIIKDADVKGGVAEDAASRQGPADKGSQASSSSMTNKTVTLVVYGTAENEEEAIKVALRSAIEQAFGTFVSANTQIINDELIKDEIVSVSAGNIEKYTLISSESLPNGKHSVSLKASVSLGKLVQYAQSKGASTEFAGQTFAMNIKLIEMRQKNTIEAYKNMCLQLGEMATEAFNYELKIEEPTISNDKYILPVTIIVRSNEVTNQIWKTMNETLNSLQLSETERQDYENKGYWVYERRQDPGPGIHGIYYYLPIPSREDEKTIDSMDLDLNRKVVFSLLNFKLESLSNSEDWIELLWNLSGENRSYKFYEFTFEGHGPSFKNWESTTYLEYQHDHEYTNTSSSLRIYSGSHSLNRFIFVVQRKNKRNEDILERIEEYEIFNKIDFHTNWDTWNKKDAIIMEYPIELIMPKEHMSNFNGLSIKKKIQ